MISVALQQKAIKHLQTVDPVLTKIIQQIPNPLWDFNTNYFVRLVESVISQQLSTRVADIIYARFENLFPNKQINPEYTLKLADQKMRDIGISRQKISYIKDLAERICKNQILFEKFPDLSNEEIIIELTKVKGIGKWTAEMFMMFCLGRDDIFSHGDLGLRKAIQKLYKLASLPTLDQAEKISLVWKPYRSIASRYLWESLELK